MFLLFLVQLLLGGEGEGEGEEEEEEEENQERAAVSQCKSWFYWCSLLLMACSNQSYFMLISHQEQYLEILHIAVLSLLILHCQFKIYVNPKSRYNFDN
jgi:hypothetical protein